MPPGTGRAVIVSLSLGAQRALLLAAGHPDRVAGAVFIAPFTPLGSAHPPDPWSAGMWSCAPSIMSGRIVVLYGRALDPPAPAPPSTERSRGADRSI